MTTAQAAPAENGIKPVPELIAVPSDKNPREITFQYRANPISVRYELHCGDGRYVARQGAQFYTHTFDEPVPAVLAVARELGNGKILARAVVAVRAGLEPDVTLTRSDDPNEPYLHYLTFPDLGQIITPYEVDWDDDTETVTVYPLPGQLQVRRQIPAGSYTVRVLDVAAKIEKALPLTVASPYDPDWEVTDATDTDPTGMSVKVTITKTEAKPVTIEYGDDLTDEISNPTNGTAKVHAYARARDYWITVKYSDGSGTPVRYPVSVPWK